MRCEASGALVASRLLYGLRPNTYVRCWICGGAVKVTKDYELVEHNNPLATAGEQALKEGDHD